MTTVTLSTTKHLLLGGNLTLALGGALGELGTDGLALGGAVDLGVLGTGLLDVGKIGTNDGTGDLGHLGGAALHDTVGGGLLMQTAEGLGPSDVTGVDLAAEPDETLLALEGKHGLGADEGVGNVADAMSGVDGVARELALFLAHISFLSVYRRENIDSSVKHPGTSFSVFS